MNGIFNFVRFITYSLAAVVVRRGWNWLTADVDPIPGTKEFNKEYQEVEEKYKRMRKSKEEYDSNTKIR